MINIHNLRQELIQQDEEVHQKVLSAITYTTPLPGGKAEYAMDVQLQVLEAIHERLGSVIMAMGLTR